MESPIRAEVKGVLIFGEGQAAGHSLESFSPPDPDYFGFNALRSSSVTPGGGLSDSFDVVVCSPAWFASQVAQGSWDRFNRAGLRELPESIVIGSGLWFMRRWDSTDFMDALGRVCDALSPGTDWGSAPVGSDA